MTDPVSVAVLMHCIGTPNHLRALTVNFPRATLYRRTNELIQQGLLIKEGERYLTTPAGEAAVNPSTGKEKTGFDLIFENLPHLAHLPTLIHKAAALLVLGAVTARRFLQMADSLASFAFLGPPLRWKSKLAEMLLAMVGAPAECLIYCPAEGGRSLFVRRNGQGDIQTTRRILEAPLVAFDEYGRATPGVQAVIGAYLHGQREIPFENVKLELKPTPIILSNPASRKGTILDRLGVDEAQMRRLIVLDFETTTIPEEIEDKGQERLKAVRDMKPLELKAPTGLSPESRERIKIAIKAIIPLKTNLRFVDYNLVTSCIEGLTGYMSEEDAVRAGLFAYGQSLATIGFAIPGWQMLLAPEPDGPAANTTGAPVAANSFDYEENLRALHETLRANRWTAKDLKPLLDNYSAFVLLLRELGIEPKVLFDSVKQCGTRPPCRDWMRRIVEHLNAGAILMITQDTEGEEVAWSVGDVTPKNDASRAWWPEMLTVRCPKKE